MTELVMRGFGGLRNRTGVVLSVWGSILLIPLAVAAFDFASLAEILRIALGAFMGTLPYIAAAVLIIAGLIGGLAPFCSCEVIPFIAALLAAGAPVSAIMAFWLSSPLIDPSTALITAAALGWDFAAGKAVAAIGLGLFGGFAVRLLFRGPAFAAPLREGAGCGGCETELTAGGTVWRFWREAPRLATFRTEAVSNARFLVKWLALAYLLQALLVVYVPAEAIAGVVGGDGFVPIAIGALIGAPAYLNGYAAPALVAGLMQQGMSAGAAMAFMVAGSVSCIPAMVAVWSLVRRQVFAVYVALGVAGAMASGVLFGAVAG